MIIALASPTVATSLDDGLEKVMLLQSDAANQGAEIVCFPEAYLPGLHGVDIDVLPFDPLQHDRVLSNVAESARRIGISTIFCMEQPTAAGSHISAYVINADGTIQGVQTKNQLAPSEDEFYVPGSFRQIFEVNGIRFGVAICHEGWRYPETVRWAALRGAKIVFQPQHTGSNHSGILLSQWGDSRAPYYEKAMVMRSIENSIYFASVNYALRFADAATSLINPAGECQAFLPYGKEGILVQSIDPEEATGFIATRYAPQRYQEFVLSEEEP